VNDSSRGKKTMKTWWLDTKKIVGFWPYERVRAPASS
jgi:hypothetical protein